MDTLNAINASTINAATIDKIGNKRVYYCQRCLNHDRLEPRKNHKCDCVYATCTCNKCILVEKRRILNIQLHELEELGESEINTEDIDEACEKMNGRIKGERVPNCQKCGQHGRKSRLKGHKRVCPYRDCSCAKCQVVSERQKLMADQIKIRRRQRKDTLMNLTRDNITATLNVAAAVAANGTLPYFNSINTLLYQQLQNSIQQNPSFMMNCAQSATADSPACSAVNSLNYLQSQPDILKAVMANHVQSAKLRQLSVILQPNQLNSVSPPSISSPKAFTNEPSGLQIAMPVAINPAVQSVTNCNPSTVVANSPSDFRIPVTKNNDYSLGGTSVGSIAQLLENERIIKSFFSNFRLLEQKMGLDILQENANSAFVDVRGV